MQNLCQISFKKVKKTCVFALVLCLMWGLTPAAESISVKLRGKIALAGILSGLAYATHALVKNDKRAVEKLQRHLGPPDRVVQFERGFDLWRTEHYGEYRYIFRNNRLRKIKLVETDGSLSGDTRDSIMWHGGKAGRREGGKDGRKEHTSRLPFFHSSTFPPFLIDTPVLGLPKWSRLCLLRLQRAPQLVSSGLYRLEAERLLDLEPWLSR